MKYLQIFFSVLIILWIFLFNAVLQKKPKALPVRRLPFSIRVSDLKHQQQNLRVGFVFQEQNNWSGQDFFRRILQNNVVYLTISAPIFVSENKMEIRDDLNRHEAQNQQENVWYQFNKTGFKLVWSGIRFMEPNWVHKLCSPKQFLKPQKRKKKV